MSKVKRFGISIAAGVMTTVVVVLLSRLVMDNAISTTMSGLAGLVVYFIVRSVIKRS